MIPLYAIANGGEGSGNFGHEGRPGEVGGSAPSGSASPKVKEWAEQKFGAEKGKAFSDWFAGSKVVNEKGEPLVVYHGTNADFSVFDLDKKESSTFSRPGVENHYFFTPIKERANFYSGAHGEQGANVMPVFLHIKKPLIKEMSDANTGDVTNAIGDAIAGGHDGLILKWKQKEGRLKEVRLYDGSKRTVFEGTGRMVDNITYVAFHPTQIKSVWNKGKWNKSDANISNALVNDDNLALEFHRAKILLPTTLGTKELDVIGKDIHKIAFMSAHVEEARILQTMYDQLDDILSSKSTPGEMQLAIDKVLGEENYQPTKAGTIQDLRSLQRQKLIIETNTDSAWGFAQLQSMNEPKHVEEYPAMELVRDLHRLIPRDWHTRWMDAANEVGDEDAIRVLEQTGRFIALKSSGIWQALGDGAGGYEDTLGNPWPPFAFNSGMGIEEVNWDDALALGLVNPTDEEPAEAMEIPELAKGLEVSTEKLNAPGLLDVLGDSLDGIATIKNGVLQLV